MVWFAIMFLLCCSMQITQCMEKSAGVSEKLTTKLSKMSDNDFELLLKIQYLNFELNNCKTIKPITHDKKKSPQNGSRFFTYQQNEKGEWIVKNSEGGFLYQKKELQSILSDAAWKDIEKQRHSHSVHVYVAEANAEEIYEVFATKKKLGVFSGCKGVIGWCACLDTNHLSQPHIEPQMRECSGNKE